MGLPKRDSGVHQSLACRARADTEVAGNRRSVVTKGVEDEDLSVPRLKPSECDSNRVCLALLLDLLSCRHERVFRRRHPRQGFTNQPFEHSPTSCVPAARVSSEIASRSHQPTALLVFRKSSELINPCVREVKDIRPEFIGVALVALVARDSGAHGSAVHADEASEQPFAFLHLVGHLARSGDRASRRFSVAPPGSVPDRMIPSISLNVLDRAE